MATPDKTRHRPPCIPSWSGGINRTLTRTGTNTPYSTTAPAAQNPKKLSMIAASAAPSCICAGDTSVSGSEERSTSALAAAE
jgi:hypothetical protein